MSTIEERLSRDIAKVTGGVVVTESDLQDARTEVDERIENRRQRNRRRGVVAAAAAAAVVVGVSAWQGLSTGDASPTPANEGPTPAPSQSLSAEDQEFLSGSAPTADLIKGVWRLDNSRQAMSFTADGAVSFDDAGQLFTNPALEGTYAIEGDLITVEIDGGRSGCDGQTFAMRASVPEAGFVNLLHTERGPGGCAPAPTVRWVLEQVLSPTIESLADIKTRGANLDPPAGVDAVRGLWFSEGGGHVVELLPEGSFTMAGEYGEVVDRGTWSLGSANTRLTLESAADSPSCREGDRYVLGALEELADGAQSFLSGTLQRNDCGGAWAKEGWILLSP